MVQTDKEGNIISLDYEELPDASGILSKRCNIIDKHLLKAGILRQCAYTMPEGYYGIDMIIPVAVEVVKLDPDSSLEIKKTYFTYIAIQSKAGEANPMVTLVKINPNLHVQRDSFDDDEWDFLVNNY